MSTASARCPHCAASILIASGFWVKFWPFKAKNVRCRSCRRVVSVRDAQTMGAAMGHWLSTLKTQLAAGVKELNLLSTSQALRAMVPGLAKEQARSVSTFHSLVHFVTQVYRPILSDKAHGRNATLDVVVLEDSEHCKALGVLGRSSAETGEREQELLIVRVGRERYLVHLPEQATGRVMEVIRQKRIAGASAMGMQPPSVPPV